MDAVKIEDQEFDSLEYECKIKEDHNISEY